jgi:hypothetical protein
MKFPYDDLPFPFSRLHLLLFLLIWILILNCYKICRPDLLNFVSEPERQSFFMLPFYMVLHSLAHSRQASAHFLQCSMCEECFSHSTAQALQASSHFLQRASRFELVLGAAIKLLQASMQAKQSFSHCSIPDFPLHSSAQV